MPPALVISILALLFAVGSFWWMHWRRGKLNVAPPRSYGAFAKADQMMILYLPLVFYNDGPTPIIIQNLRLRFLDQAPDKPLHFVATIHKLISSEERRLATQIPVTGHDSVLLICEFQRRPAPFLFRETNYRLLLEAQTWSKSGWELNWEECVRFNLNVSALAAKQSTEFVASYDNLRDTLESNLA